MIAYIVQQQLLFPLAELDPVLWVLVGMLAARTPSASRGTAGARWLVVPIAIATAFAVMFGAREVMADRALDRGAKATDPQTRAAGSRPRHEIATRLDTRVVRPQQLSGAMH